MKSSAFRVVVACGIRRIRSEFERKTVAGLPNGKKALGYLSPGWGEKGIIMMQEISVLHPHDAACFDLDTLDGLSRDLGPSVAENILCRALEDIALRFVHIRNDYVSGNHAALRKSVHAVIPIAAQIGLPGLAHIGRDVVTCIDQADAVALAATLCRFLRWGETAMSCADDGLDLSL
jgi:hypothetical protein